MNTKATNVFAEDAPLMPNYAAMEAEDRRHENVWLNRFHWLTSNERSIYNLADHVDFPGVCAEDAEYDAFAAQLRRESSRLVPCLFQLGWGTVRGAVDVVSGATYLLDNGTYTLGTELPGAVTISFDDVPGATMTKVQLKDGYLNVCLADSSRNTQGMSLRELLNRESSPISTKAINNVVEHLAHVGKLPPVTTLDKGERNSTHHAK